MTRKTLSFTRRVGWAGALALTALLGPAGAASAASYTVQNNNGSGTDSLRGVLALAAADSDASDTITFASGVTGTIALGGTELAIGKSVTITGPGANVLALDAGHASRVFDITAGTVTISSLTLANGTITGSGNNGGDLFNDTGTTLVLTACAVSGGSSGNWGGGMENFGTATVTRCTFSGNTAASYGGGLDSGNSQSSLTVTNCTFSGNTVTSGHGGGLENYNTASATSCTFSGNSATSGGNIGNDGGTLTMTASLLTGSTGGDVYNAATVTSGGSNLLGDANGNGFTNGVNHDRTGVPTATAGLGALAYNGGPTKTCAVSFGSPAVDADYNSGSTTDQRGTSRPIGPRNDIGAYEAPAGVTSVTVSAASASVAKGLTDQFTATAHYSDGTTANVTGTATWASDNTGAATISSAGLATANAVGTAHIVASFSGVTSSAFTLTVTAPTVSSVTVSAASASVAKGLTDQFTATAHYSDGTTANVSSSVTWASDSAATATVSSSGLATANAVGTAHITATVGGVTSAPVTLTVTAAVVSSVTVSAASASVAKGLTDQFTATAHYSDGTTADVTGTATWASDNTATATISSAGLAMANAVGTAHITATVGSVTSSAFTLSVTPAVVSSVTVTPASPAVHVGGTAQLTATAHYSDGTMADVTGTATWASDNMATATVSPSGLATGVAQGTAHVTATLGGVTSAAVTLTVPHAPATLIVTNSRDDGSAGSLRAVLAGAGPGDTVTFASNVTGTISLTGGEMTISQDVTIQGPGASVLTIDAGGSSRIFHITAASATVAISGLTLADGSAAGSPTTGGGGAIDNAGALTVTDCVLSGNSATFGGAIFDENGSALTLTDSTFAGNSSQHGGSAVWCAPNSASRAVGITGCTFSGNTANDGGAVTTDMGCVVTVTNSTFSGNTAGYGELCNDGGTLTVTGCTLSGNVGTVLTGGINNNGALTLTATLFAGNTRGDIASQNGGTVTSGGSNILGDGDEYGIVNGVGHDQTGVANAMLGPLANNGGPTKTCAVLAGSPAIGGDYVNATATDQRGVARTAARHTIGAFEYVAPVITPLVPVRTHVLWNNGDGRVMLWNLDAQGGVTQNLFGPYDDTPNAGVPGNTAIWQATALATGPDGMNHLLWNNPDGRVMLWSVDNAGNFTYAGYGPYTDGAAQNKWHAVGVSVGADNTTHLLWDNTDGRMMLWNVDGSYGFTLAGFGPYDDTPNVGVPGNTAVWHAAALATGPDNVSRIAWNDPDGRVMLWDVDSSFNFTYAGFGPYTDGAAQNVWSATGVSVGADNVTHLLWGNTDRRMMLWNVDGSYNFTLAGFGPYTDDTVGSDPSVNLWSAAAIATGGDNVSRVLWDNTDARMMLWDVDGLFNLTLAGYGPYTDILPGGQWTATAVSAAP